MNERATSDELLTVAEMYSEVIDYYLSNQIPLDDQQRSFMKDPGSVPIGEMLKAINNRKSLDAIGWMDRYRLSDQEVEEMEDADFIIDGLVISSQVNVVAAKAGIGKTTIVMHEMGKAAADGYRVMYVNMDCGAGDVKYWHQLAKEAGFAMITPHFKGADGIQEWIEGLKWMANTDADLTDLIIVVDTLKKIADMMNKTRLKGTMHLLRALTAKGCTVVCAAHCNKHLVDGKLMFEGTGDLESDCDNLIYIESEKDDAGIRTASTLPSDKVRGIFERRSWKIYPDRSVEELSGYVDVAARIQAQTQLEKDATVIELIKAGITQRKHKRVDLYEFVCTENKVSRREFDGVLRRYCHGHTSAKVVPLWRNEKQKQDNADYYILLENH